MALPPPEKQKVIQPGSSDRLPPLELAPEGEVVNNSGGVMKRADEHVIEPTGGEGFQLAGGPAYVAQDLPEFELVAKHAARLEKGVKFLEQKTKRKEAVSQDEAAQLVKILIGVLPVKVQIDGALEQLRQMRSRFSLVERQLGAASGLYKALNEPKGSSISEQTGLSLDKFMAVLWEKASKNTQWSQEVPVEGGEGTKTVQKQLDIAYTNFDASHLDQIHERVAGEVNQGSRMLGRIMKTVLDEALSDQGKGKKAAKGPSKAEIGERIGEMAASWVVGEIYFCQRGSGRQPALTLAAQEARWSKVSDRVKPYEIILDHIRDFAKAVKRLEQFDEAALPEGVRAEFKSLFPEIKFEQRSSGLALDNSWKDRSIQASLRDRHSKIISELISRPKGEIARHVNYDVQGEGEEQTVSATINPQAYKIADRLAREQLAGELSKAFIAAAEHKRDDKEPMMRRFNVAADDQLVEIVTNQKTAEESGETLQAEELRSDARHRALALANEAIGKYVPKQP